ncbi:hypothetical protein [Streptomyces hirsutus]|uniref:hypothetical protein n=1 Tax=Streptomyces hirsutus TaxID=35620 RepID=UPI00332E1B71
MTENRARAGFIGLASAALAAAALTAPGQATAAPPPIDPVAKYELYLSGLAASGNAGASETLGEFRNLPQEKKETFVDYLDNPEMGQALGEFISDGIDEENFVTEQKRELYGGDVVLESEVNFEETDDASTGASTMGAVGVQGTAGDKRAWYTVYDKIFGVKVTKVTIGVNYTTSKTRTLKVYSAYAAHYNYVPFSEFSHSPVQKWISADPGNNAHGETVWTGEWAGSEWSARQRVWADQDGFKGGYLKDS